jgi:hypothetical protein
MILPCLVIATSSKQKGGRGVYTTENIKAGTVIEISPVLVFTAAERKIVEQSKLYNYIFEWGKSHKLAALGMGYISMYNHDYNANCDYDMDYENETIMITVVKNVKKGEELFINYNASPDDQKPVWFDAK